MQIFAGSIMRIGYLIFEYGEDGPEEGFICMNRKNILSEFSKKMTALVHPDHLDESYKELKRVIEEISDDELLKRKHDLSHGWGGAAIKAFIIED